MKRLFSGIAILISLIAGGVFATIYNEPIDVNSQSISPPLQNESLAEAMSQYNDGSFKQVSGPRKFQFPKDHGPHTDYGIEWWYFTGNLTNPYGSRFGYEFTLFRIGMPKPSNSRETQWQVENVYMGHIAVTDVANETFYSGERFSRDSIGLAGASSTEPDKFSVWLKDWVISGTGRDKPEIRLVADHENIEIDLSLKALKPLVLQGDNGYSRKGSEQSNASYYYSISKLDTSGTIRIKDKVYSVSGNSWMDREWSTSALSENQIGWDWFALQLNNNHELMYYQMLLSDLSADQMSEGIIINPAAETSPLSSDDVEIQNLDYWISPSGTSYPVKWSMKIPTYSTELTITALIPNQEMTTSIKYWEGAVHIEGIYLDKPTSGYGYVESTRSTNNNLSTR